MVDVMLVVLVMFMIVSPILVSRSDINLPSTVVNNNKELSEFTSIEMFVNRSKDISIYLSLYIHILIA